MCRNIALLSALSAALAACGVASANSGGEPKDLENAALRERIEVLEQQQANDAETLAAARKLLALVKVTESGDIVITGADLYLQNGSGVTMPREPLKAKGNLILGYDEAPLDGRECPKQSAHSLVIGPYICRDHVNGALAHGLSHSVRGDWAGAYGGLGNHANGLASTVVGGMGNWADAQSSTISGGGFNRSEESAEGATLSGAYRKTVDNSFGHVAGTPSGIYPPPRDESKAAR